MLWFELHKDVTLIGYADDVAMAAVAATIEELKWKRNETLEIVSCWMKTHGLKLAQEKSKAVLITKRRKFKHRKLELDRYGIQFQDSIRYMDRKVVELQRPHPPDISQSKEYRHSATTVDAQCERP